MIKKYNQIARIKMSKQPTTNKYIDYNFNPLFLITHIGNYFLDIAFFLATSMLKK